jgi:asparagine synthase (glutamine-hydrolysing)
MFRYLAFIWNPRDGLQNGAARNLRNRAETSLPGFEVDLSENGIHVISRGSAENMHGTRVLPVKTGVVLGYLYRSQKTPEEDTTYRTASLNAEESHCILKSKGRLLISDYWGDYVALLFDDHTPRTVRIIKDPTGDLPCFFTTWQGVFVAFSLLEDCINLDLVRFSVNWDYVAYRVGGGYHDSEHDSLNEVSQVHRGECLQIDIDSANRLTRTLYWIPGPFTDSADAIEDWRVAATNLRATVRAVTHTLASCHSGILLRLSGGLDSSIIASCLADAPTRPIVTAFTSFVPGGNSGELRWAHLAAQRAAIADHIERPIEKAGIRLDGILRTRPFVSAVSLLAYLQSHLIDCRAARSRGHSAVFTGDGGDSTFGSEALSWTVDDYLRCRGLSLGVLPLAANVALCRDRLLWTVLAGALRRWCFGTRMRDFRDTLVGAATLVSKETREAAFKAQSYPHPWFSQLDHVPWSTIWRMGNLLSTPSLYDPFSDPTEVHPLRIAPLYSQPVIELALRIPLYVHFLDGHDRGLARRAFANNIPDEIGRRRWKDRSPGITEEVTLLNRNFIRDTLVGGTLVKAGFLDKGAIETTLRGDSTNDQFFAAEFYTYLDLEMWLRHFDGSQVGRFAA